MIWRAKIDFLLYLQTKNKVSMFLYSLEHVSENFERDKYKLLTIIGTQIVQSKVPI